ncbi:hypothetical protein E9232_005296 [Inquilinus ginsengisoli]|uniref:DUF3592 domain-containing protein n=1 Tax=Inquilinus ginsengisoli TaxID=363840 RepID=A0ABU1JVX5_9PROT|nr:hypothetical protein [Inquilinus ginsengisoli]MDR6292751.1 hypothetical protein [Inquilinus ginsengisoli]
MIRRLVGVALLVVGGLLLFGALQGAWEREIWRGNAVEVDGLVLPPEAGIKLAQTIPALAAAKTVVRLGYVRSVYAGLETGFATTPQPGDRVAVLMDPQQQNQAVLNDPLAIWGDQLVAGVVALVLALAGLVMMRGRPGRVVTAGGATAAIAAVLRQVAAKQAGADSSARASAARTASAATAAVKPARPVFASVVQRHRDGIVTVQRSSPTVTRTVERPTGVGPILILAVIVVALAVYLVMAA